MSRSPWEMEDLDEVTAEPEDDPEFCDECQVNPCECLEYTDGESWADGEGDWVWDPSLQEDDQEEEEWQ